MKTATIHLPGSVNEREAKMLLAAKLYERGTLTLGQAAELAGYSRSTFMELLGEFGVSLFDYTEEELDKEITNARNYHR